jgi:pilus assembly protein CpaC
MRSSSFLNGLNFTNPAQIGDRHRRLVPYALASFLLCTAAVPLQAQEAIYGTPAAAAMNGYAAQLNSGKRRSVQAIDNRPYAPIKKPTDEGQIPEIEMYVGESRVFPSPGVARIAVGNGAILNAAALDGKEIILFANAAGTSSLFVWNEDGRHQRVKINIVPGDTSRYAREIAAFLTTIPRAKASIIGDKVIVEGDNLTDADLARIDLLSKRYPQIVNFTNPLGFETMVMLDVKVVEFPTNELRELGLKWNATGGAAVGGIWSPIRRGNDGPYQINVQTGANNASPIVALGGTGPVVLPNGLNILSVLNLGLNATLSALAQQGRTTILAEPQLSARNGSKASFLAGGEIPYSVTTSDGTTILFKPYGVKLDIQPKVDSSGNVRATIETEVSNIDPSVSTSFGPALLTRKTSTEFNVRSGETIVLSGLIQRETASNIDKVPGLGDIPIIGALFRSKKFQNKETELVLFVTPTIINPSSPGIAGRVQRTNERLEERLGPKPHLTDPLQPNREFGRPDLPEPPVAVSALPRPAQPALALALAQPPAVAPPSAAPSGVPVQAETRQAMAAAPAVPASIGLPAVSFERPQGSTVRSKVNGLVIRSGPSVQSESLLQVERHAVLTLRQDTEQTTHSANWLPVQTGQVSGWVAKYLVEPAKLMLSVQSQRLEAPQATSIRPGSELLPGLADSLTLGDLAIRGRAVVVAKRLPLLLTPDINAPAALFVDEGQIVNRLALAPRGAWTAVDIQGQRGWLSTPWLQPVQDLSNPSN